MSFRHHQIRLAVLSALCVAGLPLTSANAEGIGFQATLDTPPSLVSPWVEPSYDLSVAAYPKSYPLLSASLQRTPKVVSSDWKDKSLRFNTSYYQRGKNEKQLVPVSVGGLDYAYYVNQRYDRDQLRDASSKNIVASTQSKPRTGLGITVPLPKRLDGIFGEGGAGLRVSGFRRITFSGRSQWTDAADNDTFRQNKFPSLNMEQVSRFDITGTIGSKINVKVSQDNQTDIPLANRIQIRYKGDDDEILKTIEAGNTTLNLPNTKFVGYSSQIRGLFGIKAQAQVGGLNLTAIASQEKGTSEKSSFTASGEQEAQFHRDYDYVEARVFDLALTRDSLRATDSITTLLIYELEPSTQKSVEAKYANLWVDPSDPSVDSTEAVRLVKVMQLQTNEYVFYQDRVRNRHYVVFNTSRQTSRDLGYYMEFLRDGQKMQFGDVSYQRDSILNLKLLYKQAAAATPSQQTWQLMWRNCYEIPRGITADEIQIKVFKGLNGTERSGSNLDGQAIGVRSQNYLEILGLDQYTNGAIGQKMPDGKIDDRDEVFRSDWGLLVFPSRRPFESDTFFVNANSDTTARLSTKVAEIYAYNSFTQKTDKSQYYIMMYTKKRGSIISLNKANIIEGSERVLLNGQPLAKGADYDIQYDFGRITLLSDRAMDPNADITVEFESAPFFAIQKKTLLGLRAEYKWSENFQLGSTLLYKSDKAQDRKPRVGQETAKMLVTDFDASLKLAPRIFTKLVDALPIVQTEAPSTLSLSGEIAQSRPNPNVDNVAFVDDFESALENLSLGSSRTNWTLSSRPIPLPEHFGRGRMLWHSPREQVPVTDVYDRGSAPGEGTIRTLRLVFRPNIKDTTFEVTGQGNDTMTVIKDITDIPRPTWSGVMRYFGSRVDAKRAQLFEVRARKSANFSGKLHFDFGIISEDINGNGRPDSEDLPPQDGAVTPEEDVGLDLKPDVAEPLYNRTSNPDPNGDDWFFEGNGTCPLGDRCGEFIDNRLWETNDSLYYEWLNGTEGNRIDVSAYGLPDEEVLSSGGFETNNAYFSYVIDFDERDRTSKFFADSLMVEGSQKGPWVTYRIPVRDSSFIDSVINRTSADWAQIKHVRVWWESSPGQVTYDTLEVAAWYFVQSNWQDSVVFSPLSDRNPDSATSFMVASIGEDENPAFKSTPAKPYKDPTTGVVEPRRGLLLKYSNLHVGDSCLATKDLVTVDRYSGYRRMEMYVYSNVEQNDVGKLKMYYRLGTDADNFYEQQNIMYPGWDSRNYINIDFNAITGLKDEGLKKLQEGETLDITRGSYRVHGRPNINEVRYFVVGLVNTDSTQAPNKLAGEVWLDELRVTDVRRDVGTAGRFSMSGNMADLISFGFSLQSEDPYFRGMSSATRGGSSNNLGSGATQTSYTGNASINFDKFFPRSWQARIPIAISYSKAVTTPLLRTSSDIVIPEERRKEEQTISESKTFSISESFKKKGKNPLFNLVLNRLTTGFSYRRNAQKSVNVPFSFGENYNVDAGFDLGITKVPTIPIFFWTKPLPILRKAAATKLYLYPKAWRTSADYSRNLTITDDVNLNRRSSLSRDFSGSMDITYDVFDPLSLSYHYGTRRDLSDPSRVSLSPRNFRLGVETNFDESFSASYSPNLLSFLTTSYSYKASYRDDLNRTSKTLQSSLGTSWSIGGTFDHMKLLGKSEGKGSLERFGITETDKVVGGKKGGGRAFYEPPLAVLRFLTSWLKPLSYRYGTSYNSSLPGIETRPSWRYRFGLTRDANVHTADNSRSPSSDEGVGYEFGSGFQLLGGISTEVKYRQNITRSLVTQGERFENTSTSWPDLSIRIQKFSHFPFIKNILNKFIDVFAPRTGYTRQVKENFNLTKGFVTSRQTSIDHNPLLQVNFKLLRSLSLTGSYTLGKDHDEVYNPTTGRIDSEKKSTRKQIGLSTKYSFSSPGGISIPLLGKLKFKSRVDLEMNVKMASDKSEVASNGGPYALSVDKSEMSIIPVISYVFSEQIKGGLSGRWQDSSDNKRSQKSHVRELRIWAEISF